MIINIKEGLLREPRFLSKIKPNYKAGIATAGTAAAWTNTAWMNGRARRFGRPVSHDSGYWVAVKRFSRAVRYARNIYDCSHIYTTITLNATVVLSPAVKLPIEKPASGL